MDLLKLKRDLEKGLEKKRRAEALKRVETLNEKYERAEMVLSKLAGAKSTLLTIKRGMDELYPDPNSKEGYATVVASLKRTERLKDKWLRERRVAFVQTRGLLSSLNKEEVERFSSMTVVKAVKKEQRTEKSSKKKTRKKRTEKSSRGKKPQKSQVKLGQTEAGKLLSEVRKNLK